ncbi:MAG TPA: hypothetical protein VEB64_16490 [Azospirillaceae bacterium]|nr:hypothetical protein [Azospirillaceae bacterium]
MPPRKVKLPGRDFEVAAKPTRRKKAAELPNLSPDLMKQALAPLAESLPSLHAPTVEPEILPPEPKTVSEFASAIRTEWESAQERFLRIGELLDMASLSLGRDGIAQLDASLPFGRSAKSQLLTAYRAIRSGRVPEEVASAGYATVYLLAAMDDDAREAAKAEGLLRPDVRQADVKAFRARFSQLNNSAQPAYSDRLEALCRERDRLRARLAEIERELSEAT